jgi:hypothetical protein
MGLLAAAAEMAQQTGHGVKATFVSGTHGLAHINGDGGLERGPHGVGVKGDSGSWQQS